MLKGKSNCEVAACSCRTKAETLARSINSHRIWPGTWGIASDRMPEQEDEEFFEASPSPVEEEECGRGEDSSAATLEGRAKLYELLQQHAADDATDVFYDVSDNAESPGKVAVKSKSDCTSLKNNYHDSSDKSEKYDSNDLIVDEINSDSSMKFQNIANHPKIVSEAETTIVKDNSKVMKQIENENLQNVSDCKCDCLASQHTTKPQTKGDISELVKSSSDCVPISTSVNPQKNHKFTDSSILSEMFPVNDDTIVSNFNHPNSSNSEDTTSENLSNQNNTSITQTDKLPDNANDEANTRSVDQTSISPVQITEEQPSPTKLSSLHTNDTNNSASYKPDPRSLVVFEEMRPMISRSTSLKTGKTPPGTPSRKKIVRFADVFGLDLEDVRHIISGDLPEIPLSAYSDLTLSDEDKPSPPNTTIQLTERPQSSWRNHTAIGPNSLYPTFVIPGQQPNFWDKVQAQGVCLESVTVSDFNVQCTCRVMNWGFHKKVLVRYSINNWASSMDVDASFVVGSSQRNTDSFTFNIFLPPTSNTLEFALRFEINGKEYWDNNGGNNYCFRRHSNQGSMQVSMPSTWVHQFW